MAQVLQGSFNTTAHSNRHLVFSWTATQNIANNTTTVSWSLKGAGTASGYYIAGNFKVVIAGDTVYNSTTRIQLYNGTTVASGTKVITHNTDGSKSFSASVQAGIYSVAVNCSGSATWELKSIPRAATITSAPNFNDEQNPVVQISNPAGNAVDALDICITLSGSADDIAYRAVTKTATSYTFTLTDAERKTLRAATSGANSRRIGFYLRTNIGGTKYYSKVWRDFTIINGQPTLSISAADTGGNSTALTGAGGSTIINGFNVIKVSTGATAKKEATIKSQSIKCGGQTINAASGTFTNVKTTDGKITFTATDNRNNTVTASKTFTVIPYFEPTIKLAKRNVSTNGVFTIGLTGTFFNGSFGAVTNAPTVQYRWKAGSDDWGDWTTVSPIKNGNNWSFSGDKTGLDYKETYSVQARITDSLISKDGKYITTDIYTASAVPAFDWGKDDFQHNTHVIYENSKAIFGIDTDGNRFTALEPCTANNVTSLGWGSYANQKGRTEIWGNAIHMNGSALNDFVVETGSGGIWTWRKWNSGLAECWGISTITTDIAAPFGSGFLSGTSAGASYVTAYFPTGLFKSVIETSMTANEAGSILFTTGGNFNTERMNVYIWCPNTSYTNKSIKMSFSAVGKWK